MFELQLRKLYAPLRFSLIVIHRFAILSSFGLATFEKLHISISVCVKGFGFENEFTGNKS